MPIDFTVLARHVSASLEQIEDDYHAEVDDYKRRLREAGEREMKLKNEVEGLRREIATLRSFPETPDVRAKRLKEAQERRAAADREINALTDRGIHDLANQPQE